MVIHTGTMSVAQLDKYIKGYGIAGAEVIDTNMQAGNFLEGVFPTTTIDNERFRFVVTHGNPGVMGVALDGAIDSTTWSYTEVKGDIDWDKYQYMVTDSAKTRIAVDRIATDGNMNALKYFGAIRSYEIITALKAGNNSSCTSAASAYWNAAAGNAEGDIMAAVEGIVQYSGADLARSSIGVIYPAKVMRGLKELDLIHNQTQRLEKYLKEMFAGETGGINFYPYTPYMNADGDKYIDSKQQTSSDALGTSALVFVEGPDTLRTFKYSAPGIPMAETTRVHDQGWLTTLRHNFGCKVVPRYNSTTTPLIYELTSVSA